MTLQVSLTVNGRPIEAAVEPRTHLADFLRDVLHLTGTHLGCEHGVCGACTVLVDGAPTRSCIAYAVACDSADVRTIEGFDADPLMQALRHAFTRHHALQCGFCTPGMLITAHDIVRRIPGADEARVREELSGNLCRCTGYVGIVAAVRAVLAEPPARAEGTPASTAEPTTPFRDDGERLTASDPARRTLPGGSDTGVEVQVASIRLPEAPTRFGATASAPRTPARVENAPDPTSPDWAREAASADSHPRMPLHASNRSRTAGSRHKVVLAIAPDPLWRVLRDIPTVVRCLPGASLAGPPHAAPLALEMAVSIGPMRARFEGSANVVFDDRRRTVTVDGSGKDARSRSTGEGRIELAVVPDACDGSILHVRLHHALKGPLAQFSRSAVVDAVAEHILERFAANLASAAVDGNVDSESSVAGFRLAMVAVRRWLKRRLTRTDR